MPETIAPGNLTPPHGFRYNPDNFAAHEEQLKAFLEAAAYQEKPIPSFEAVPTLAITPRFNPTGATEGEIFARGRMADSLRPYKAPRSEWTADEQPVPMWRIVERARLEDGTGLVSSRILRSNNLGDVEGFNPTKHLASTHADRLATIEATTPFVSFSTDPEALARSIVRKGFGVKAGRDSVVVQVQVAPDRVITDSGKKDPEVLLLGGVAPGEYMAAYSVQDFITQLLPEGKIITARGDVVQRDTALGHWALRG